MLQKQEDDIPEEIVGHKAREEYVLYLAAQLHASQLQLLLTV